MRNLKRWKRLMAVAMCSAMMFSVPMGVSATDDEDTDKTPVVETTETETVNKDSADTPDDGSGDVTTPTNKEDVTDAEGGNTDADKEDSGEVTGKTKVTLSGGGRKYYIRWPFKEEYTLNFPFYYNVVGATAEEVIDMIDVKVVNVTAKKDNDSTGTTIDCTSGTTITEITKLSDTRIQISAEISGSDLKTAGIGSGGYGFVTEISITCKNEAYELEVDNVIDIYGINSYIEGNTNSDSDTGSNDKPSTDSNEYSISDVNISKSSMESLVQINKTKDIVIKTPSGLSYVFKKGDFNLVGDKAEYNFNVTLSSDFSNSGIKNTNVTSDIFACRINYAYNGQLPGTAYISIPVDSKWNGSTLYYYQLMSDGTLKDTGLRNKVANGICEVTQSHCSDYVLLAKSPSELGIASVNGQITNTNSNGNTSTKVTSPKTGDTTTVLLFVFLCMGACLVGTGAIAVRRKSN